MGSLNSLYLKLETLETLVKTVKAKNEKGVEITVSLDDKENQFGQNVSAYVSQSKEQRDKKTPRYYVGNGKTFWSNENNLNTNKVEKVTDAVAEVINDDLPF